MDRKNSSASEFKLAVAESEEEYQQIYRFRYRIYEEEMGKNCRNSDHQRKILKDELDKTGIHLYAKTKEGVKAAIRLNFGSDILMAESLKEKYALGRFAVFPVETLSLSSRLMVAPEWRGTTVLARLLNTVGFQPYIRMNWN